MSGQASFSCSSSFGYGFTYDVFLNFRGLDTRHGFTGNLYKALNDRGIHTFIDDERIQRGEEITSSLANAIEESRIAIPVFSKNYASSSFCLDELVMIIDCIKAKGRLVLPIFYDLDPSHVRHQSGSYGEALAKHEERFKHNKEEFNENMERLVKWKMALKQAANLSGKDFKLGNEYEHEFIGKIVKEVCNKINRAPLHVADYPVGLESRVLEVNSLLNVGFDDGVHMVGIYGIGGMGKRTIALAVYNYIADLFEGLCFLDNVRENSIKYGLVHLQEMLLAEIVGEKEIRLGSVNKGISIIKHRLHRKKVLLILDDVSELEQLRAIAGGSDWFGSGSRVVITTRDKHLLISHGVERIFELEGLNDKEALELLSWNAFKTNIVDPSYVNILNRAISYASGLPLALEVIGSNLFGKRIEEWESALNRYERIPDKGIQKILKVSFDSLEEDQQRVFLDIACCFQGYELAEVEDILQAHHGVCMKYGINLLVQKSLIKTDQIDHVLLHDLIQDMGREIVRLESPEKPGKRSRLWFHEDIVQVLEENGGSSKTQIINLSISKSEEVVEWDGEAFKKMKNLKTLIIKKGHFSEGPKHLPNSLRVLEWWGYPSQSLPSDFHPKKLVIFKLPHSSFMSRDLSMLLRKMLVNVRVLNFDKCEYITHIPDVSGVPYLEKLSFSRCKNLIKIDESVGFLDKLRILDAQGCIKLGSFPPIKLTSLEELNLSYCSSLENFPELVGKMENMKHLSLIDTNIRELPFSIQNLTQLLSLQLRECGMVQIPSSIVMLPELEELSVCECEGLKLYEQEKGEVQVSSKVCSRIECVDLRKCNISDEFLPIILAWFANVKQLDLSGTNFTILPACIKECHFLWEVRLDNCENLQEIKGVPPNIKRLSARNCTSLTSSCRSMLLDEELHAEGGDKTFILPGKKIPEWFEHRSREPTISFWFRNKFPALSLCIITRKNNKQLKDVYSAPFGFHHELIINGNREFPLNQGYYSWISEVDDHIVIFDINLEDNVDLVVLENSWNHVVFSIDIPERKPMDIWTLQTGLHVFKKRNNMKDILFTYQHMEQDTEWPSLLTTPALNANVNSDSNSMVSKWIISSTTSFQGMQEKQNLTSIVQQSFEGCESVNEAKGKGMITCNSKDEEHNERNPLLELLSKTKEYQMASDKNQHGSNEEENMCWDPMELEWQVTHSKHLE
ncbi:TMV resistance protein N-like [Gastrolobium bilobum]|uniref:TMV resistance protein N-like n=1 Tax=Gastrolobium bilobum TaxID=150636 RepID=UPI002AB066D2|nr:TMV resistance protein N-like [Gastrolobium bilobum]